MTMANFFTIANSEQITVVCSLYLFSQVLDNSVTHQLLRITFVYMCVERGHRFSCAPSHTQSSNRNRISGKCTGKLKKKNLKILFQVILIIKEIRETLDYAAVHRSVPGWWNIKHLENLL